MKGRRGPFTLIAYSQHPEWRRGKLTKRKVTLATGVKAREVEEMACMYLLDPRDEWTVIYVWDEGAKQYAAAFWHDNCQPHKGRRKEKKGRRTNAVLS